MAIENYILPAAAPRNPIEDMNKYLTYNYNAQLMADKQAEQNLAMEQQRRYDEEQALFLNNPKPTVKDAVRFMGAMTPQQQAGFKPVFEQIDQKELRSSMMFGSQVMSALETDPAVAQRLLKDRAEAERNSGNADSASFIDQIAAQAASSPENAMKSVTMFMSTIPGAKDFFDAQYGAGQESRAQALAPYQQGSEMALAQQRQTASQANLASAAESYAGVGLKQAQAETSRQLAQKYLVETNKTLKEMAGNDGTIPEKDKPDMEYKLRKEYNTETKVHKDVLESYRRIEATEDTAVGDISLIFAYMKMLDPASVVREGEQATAQNARGVPDTIMNAYNKALSGERLTENQRKQFRSQANKLADASKETEKTVRAGLTRISKKYGLDSDNIFYDVNQTPTQGGGATVRLPDGKVMQFPSQKEADLFKKETGIK
jgi:hypothetical protein